MRRHRNVKIVATLGPASDSGDIIAAMFRAGADVFRLNMSHGSHAEIAARHQRVREVEAETGRPICILADLQGPKLRCGNFAEGQEELASGDVFRFDLDPAAGTGSRVCLPHPEIFAALSPGSRLLVNDGQIRLRVDACSADFANCRVEVGGLISDRKGVHVPDAVLPVRALSEKDRHDLEFACSIGVDWLALSFVQRPEDLDEARELVAGRAAIMAKIEKPAAVDVFDGILANADGIMVARGDLGVELPVQNVPPIQKRLVRASRNAGKPVVVATQMLESMTAAPVPTRAEVSDVATAIYEGADAVMLSAESATGDHPVEAVKMMNDVAIEVERDAIYRQVIEASRSAERSTVADAITVAARRVAETTDIKVICCFTHSGTTAALAARERPKVPIIALTPLKSTARRLGIVWGLHCVLTDVLYRFKQAVVNAARAARDGGFADSEDRIVVTAGIPFNTTGSTNILRVAPADERRILKGDEG
ncbi:MAG: pyruvate kinase [Paracoccaceae bacterium]|nr:pyruvate kinase [Paracoccaceae bacterium]